MSGRQWATQPVAVTRTSTSALTGLTVIGASNSGYELLGFSFSTDGAQAGLYLVEICMSDGTSNGTASGGTLVGIGESHLTTNENVAGSTKNTYSGEPTVLTPFEAFRIPAGTPFAYRWPLGERPYIGPSPHLIAMRVTPPGTTSSIYTAAMSVED